MAKHQKPALAPVEDAPAKVTRYPHAPNATGEMLRFSRIVRIPGGWFRVESVDIEADVVTALISAGRAYLVESVEGVRVSAEANIAPYAERDEGKNPFEGKRRLEML